ncbi:phosphoribosylanthranilate isomerase [Fuchsiella alkaliacetigena]|uniref:phosphoribosylanthranilate isomerase n=1 Tax=Fuchsiella alkaliacetigena TaxID=957042 RepID=UPI00200A23DA|nr:phosphoribosylanthranilate isomerase [Fuchsiella alkaliacetigena]MCK8825897.1 phosphoribosylanthranilate isomerase [Fuchsiella alkaliacetigena]
MTRIKICGITNLEDALRAVEQGVDSLGFILAASPRQVSPERVKEIVDNLPPFINKVGVFVDEELAKVKEIVSYCGLDTVQLHGSESPEYCQEFANLTVVKAFRIKDQLPLLELKEYAEVVTAYLLDTYVAGQAGGTGETFNWNLAEQAKEAGPIILAGGLKPENIVSAIRDVAPYGVDVSSGVEKEPGVKDHDRLVELVNQVNSV